MTSSLPLRGFTVLVDTGAPRARPIAGASIVLTTGVYDQIESVISVGVVPLLKPFTREQLKPWSRSSPPAPSATTRAR